MQSRSSTSRLPALVAVAAIAACVALGTVAILAPGSNGPLATLGDNAWWLRFAALPIIALFVRWTAVTARRATAMRVPVDRHR